MKVIIESDNEELVKRLSLGTSLKCWETMEIEGDSPLMMANVQDS